MHTDHFFGFCHVPAFPKGAASAPIADKLPALKP